MKPRTGAGPIEVEKDKGQFIVRLPLGDGERLVVALDVHEADALARLLANLGEVEEQPPRIV
jgi:hypothetical protein